MKAIILSAGQGGRLLPLTETRPKCLLSLGDVTIIEHQIDRLNECGISDISIVTGFAAGTVEEALRSLPAHLAMPQTIFNPFFNVADNLASCWMARDHMQTDFLLLNGDTVFESAVCEKLMRAPSAPITLAIDQKTSYDSDDMKVRLDGSKLLEVGKTLSPENVNGESIGMMRFQGIGPGRFVRTLDQIMRTPNSLSWWYLKAIGILAERDLVQTESIAGLIWGEVDFLKDLENVRRLFGNAKA
jgi:L-glutamine-phosphate cytidylyltransferase